VTDIDVVIPVRDGGHLLGEAVASVLDQQGVDVRAIVVDDGSTDGAPERLPRDPRITVVPTAGTGIVGALNTGVALATAPYIARQDADDVSLPGRLAAQAELLDQHPGIGLVATAFEVLVGGRVVTTMRTTPGGMLTKNRICAGSTVVRREVLAAAGGYRQQFRLSSDYDAWLRCVAVSGLAILPIVGYQYRLHAQMSTIRLAAVHPAYSALAKASAQARMSGRPDPAENLDAWLADRLPPPEEQEQLTAEVAAWWAAEFAALGSRGDAIRCVRRAWPRLSTRRRGRLLTSLVRPPASQSGWQ
jgi:glycosyltransferase involved in cell wall biosynthesis